MDRARPPLTGGLSFSKNVSSKERAITNESEQVLYLFRASGAGPWILRERAAGSEVTR